jgi:hypothetical protein
MAIKAKSGSAKAANVNSATITQPAAITTASRNRAVEERCAIAADRSRLIYRINEMVAIVRARIKLKIEANLSPTSRRLMRHVQLSELSLRIVVHSPSAVNGQLHHPTPPHSGQRADGERQRPTGRGRSSAIGAILNWLVLDDTEVVMSQKISSPAPQRAHNSPNGKPLHRFAQASVLGDVAVTRCLAIYLLSQPPRRAPSGRISQSRSGEPSRATALGPRP